MRLKTSALTAALCVALAPAAFANDPMKSSSGSQTGTQAGSMSSQPAAGSQTGAMSGSQSGSTMGSGSMGTRSDAMASDKGHTARMHATHSASQVRGVQQHLKDKGHDPGAIDGVMGPKTQAALREFQRQQGLTASGRLDPQTLTALGLDQGAGTRATTSPDASSTTGGAAGRPGMTDNRTGPERSGTSSPSTTGPMPGGTTGGRDTPPTTPPSGTSGSGTSPQR